MYVEHPGSAGFQPPWTIVEGRPTAGWKPAFPRGPGPQRDRATAGTDTNCEFDHPISGRLRLSAK